MGSAVMNIVFQIVWPHFCRAATEVETSSLNGAMYDRRARAAAPQLPSQCTDLTARRRLFRPTAPAVSRRGASGRAYCGLVKPSRDGPKRRNLPGSPFNVPEVEDPIETLAVGDLVTHDKYGLGRVTGAEGETVVLVDFGTARLRIALPCAKLIKL